MERPTFDLKILGTMCVEEMKEKKINRIIAIPKRKNKGKSLDICSVGNPKMLVILLELLCSGEDFETRDLEFLATTGGLT